MDKLLYEILLGFIYFMFVTSLILVPFSVVKLAKRKKNGIYIIKVFLFYGCKDEAKASEYIFWKFFASVFI